MKTGDLVRVKLNNEPHFQQYVGTLVDRTCCVVVVDCEWNGRTIRAAWPMEEIMSVELEQE
jgi:hypothetical protein